jgi:hypothetical protein
VQKRCTVLRHLVNGQRGHVASTLHVEPCRPNMSNPSEKGLDRPSHARPEIASDENIYRENNAVLSLQQAIADWIQLSFYAGHVLNTRTCWFMFCVSQTNAIIFRLRYFAIVSTLTWFLTCPLYLATFVIQNWAIT